MKKEQKEKYESPSTQKTQVNLESGFMSSASVFEDGDKHDEGVSIEGHSIGNSGNYFDENPNDPKWNQWD